MFPRIGPFVLFTVWPDPFSTTQGVRSQPEATGEKTFQPQYLSLKDITENQSEATDFSSNYNPEGVGKMYNTTTDPDDTADTADTGKADTTNSPPSNCVKQLEIQVKEFRGGGVIGFSKL